MTERKTDIPEHLKPIQIRFGDVFTTNKNLNPGLKYVITHLVPDHNCCEGVPLTVKNGQECTELHFGSTTRSDINEIVDHFNLKRVLRAVMVAYGDKKPVGQIYDLLREYSKSKPMKIF